MRGVEIPVRLLGGRVIDPATGTDAIADLWVDARGVHHDAPEGFAAGAAEVDLAGRVVCPAFVEIHAHLREPGGEASETIATGLAAARAGGYGHVLAMANTSPANDHPDVTRRLLEAARAAGTGVAMHPVSAVTVGLEGRTPAPWDQQIAAVCVALSDGCKPVADAGMLESDLTDSA